ncbi:hypothetical protein TNCV_1686641 [Trichonephila clavipes]|nr:hypothetical protein TNCV_1686641 [Trichonephila clavipes]
MFDSSSYVNPTPLAHADTSRDVFPRGVLFSCKEQLPAPGNRSNERRDREKDLATTGEKKGRNGREERVAKKKPGS